MRLVCGSCLIMKGTSQPEVQNLDLALRCDLHIGDAGDEAKDVFSGMGVDLSADPAFNFRYPGFSFGRSSGIFNVRPNPTATSANPSLRFMTKNSERMIITHTGQVGIGTSAPKAGLQVDN